MPIIEAAIAGATATILGAFWLADRIVKATLADEAQAEERERMKDPATVKAARAAIAERRRILLDRLDRYRTTAKMWEAKWHDADDADNYTLKNFNTHQDSCCAIEAALMKLAQEEALIPLLDDKP
jgi:hypothetical protein